MNYITSCPACGTQFLLNKEHLKARRGKVQCGHCEHIFNAKNRLTEISDEIHSPAEYNASLEVQAQDEKPISEVLNVVLESVPNLENLESSHEASNPYISETIIKSDSGVSENYIADQIQTPITIEDLTVNPKFHKPKTKLNIWMMTSSLLLAVLAGIQLIYFSRSKIAADYPQFKPYLVQACVALNCKVDLPKNLDLLTIDDSDMQEDEQYKDVIRFSSLLINNASYPQAYPNIELTLTDTSEQPVLRRLIKPSDYLAANTHVASGIGSREEVRINLAISVKEIAVAGYRVLLVY
jgi:predicted Zn finger-like uncharacterized protein